MEFPGIPWGYLTLEYILTFAGTPITTKTVDVSTQQVNLAGLIKDTIYRISVLASTIKGNGNYGDPIVVKTDLQDSKSETLTRNYIIPINFKFILACKYNLLSW